MSRRNISAAEMALVLTVSSGFAVGLCAQSPADTSDWTAERDHRNMMDQLHIKTLRPGPSGNESAPNHANCDEAAANPYSSRPDVLTLRSGRKVTTAAMWWKQRRPEIVEDSSVRSWDAFRRMFPE